MIFFIIEQSKLAARDRSSSDFTTITTSAPDRKILLTGSISLISWNEVPAYDTLDKLKTAVLAEAKSDPVCVDICAQALSQYGIDPFLEHCGSGNLDQATMEGIVNKIFFQWAHPMIGNIGQSPRVRPELYHSQYLQNWSHCRFIDDTTKSKILDLFKPEVAGGLKPMDRSGRDQVRICYNITELARSIIGELSTTTSRRLDKIFALQLCKSASLKTKQINLIMELTTKLGSSLKTKFFRSNGLGKSEYLRYYFPDTLNIDMRRDRNYEPQWYLYENLIKIATDDQYTVTSTYVPDVDTTKPIIDSAIDDWKKLPDQMKCVILINSFRRFVNIAKCSTKLSVGLDDLDRTLTNKIFQSPYKIVKSAGTSHVPQISFNSRGSLTWSWNRDEYHPATITYRHYLMPLWGGPSGHGTGNVKFLDTELDLRFPICGANIVLTGLFAFWRLYYDKRISVVHTLAETMEGTICFSGYNDTRYNLTLTIDDIHDIEDDDAFEIVEDCTYKGRRRNDLSFVNPILLMQTIKKKYYNYTDNHQTAYEDLQTQLDALRTELTGTPNNYNVPQWSKELTTRKGMSVKSFAYTASDTRADLAQAMLEVARINYESSVVEIRRLSGDS